MCMDGLGDYGACDIGLDRVGSVREPPRDAGSSHPRSANVGSQSKSYCGDGVCDPQTERSYAHGPNTGRLNDHACEADCGSYTCGNRVIEGPEECDDGNTRSDDGCSTYCKLETLGSPPTAPEAGGQTATPDAVHPTTSSTGDATSENPPSGSQSVSPPGTSTGDECGDGICGSGEDCTACASDCGTCRVSCSNVANFVVNGSGMITHQPPICEERFVRANAPEGLVPVTVCVRLASGEFNCEELVEPNVDVLVTYPCESPGTYNPKDYIYASSAKQCLTEECGDGVCSLPEKSFCTCTADCRVGYDCHDPTAGGGDQGGGGGSGGSGGGNGGGSSGSSSGGASSGGSSSGGGQCADLTHCLSATGSFRSICGGSDFEVKVVNQCAQTVSACTWLQRDNGGWDAGCFTLSPSETGAYWICGGTGEARFGATTEDQSVHGCFEHP